VKPVLLDYVESLGHAVFTEGEFNLNIIGIRSETHKPNKFDDRICVVYKDESGWITRTFEATTDPGQYWLDHPMRPEGAAILVPGQYRGVYKIGTHRNYTALTQRGGRVKVYRDGNKDEILDHDPESITEGYYGINIHKAGTESTNVNKWSAGCQVFARSDDFECFMALVKKSADIWGEFFTYTLVDEPMM
tara:strand:+ start:2793 stop:3365 length:573 start_codon:yes stop_codon:yes gene_type:complete